MDLAEPLDTLPNYELLNEFPKVRQEIADYVLYKVM